MKYSPKHIRRDSADGGRIGFALCAGAVVAADQLSKFYIRSAMAPNDSIPVIPGFFHLTFIYNTGASFGLFREHAGFFTIISGLLLAVICLAAFFLKSIKKPERALLGLIAGGALGNLIDRILRAGAVVDFIDFRGIWPYIFNIADMGVVCGGFLLVLAILLGENGKGRL